MRMKNVYIVVLLTLLMTVATTYLLANNKYISNITEMEQQDTIITVKELYDAFKKDEAAATKKYGKETITIKGFAVFIGPDVYALPSVELSEKKDGKSRILCVLPFSDYLKLRKVSKGNEVVITGEVRGFYEKGDQVLLKQCEIDEVIKNDQ